MAVGALGVVGMAVGIAVGWLGLSQGKGEPLGRRMPGRLLVGGRAGWHGYRRLYNRERLHSGTHVASLEGRTGIGVTIDLSYELVSPVV